MRLLLIEDHKPLVRALRKGLEEEGFAVDTAFDGEEGAYKAQTADYDVIILDLMLPKEDGLSLLQRWRRAGLKSRRAWFVGHYRHHCVGRSLLQLASKKTRRTGYDACYPFANQPTKEKYA